MNDPGGQRAAAAPLTTITSLGNETVKWLVRLGTHRQERERTQTFLVEGLLENERALRRGWALKELIICRELLAKDATAKSREILAAAEQAKAPLVAVSEQVFKKIAYRGESGGVLGVFAMRSQTLSDLVPAAGQSSAAVSRKNARTVFLVLVDIEKPGNVGAILRSADAAGVAGVILSGRTADVFNPNTVRNSLGALFSVPIVVAERDALMSYFLTNGIPLIGACLADDALPHVDVLRGETPVAIVLGPEDRGLSAEWLAQCSRKVMIPMRGICDSLNVSVAAALLVYEALRK